MSGPTDAEGAALERLIARGRERGYVSFDEVNAAMPRGRVSAEFSEDAPAWLIAFGILVVAGGENGEGRGA